MSCRCGCGSCGMGNLAFSILPGGLRGLGGLLKAGTPFSQGFQVNPNLPYGSPNIFEDTDVDRAVKDGSFVGCLASLSLVPITITQKGSYDIYLQVDGIASSDWGQPEDLRSVIMSQLNDCLGRTDLITKVYPIAIGNPPPEFREDPRVAQSNYQEYYGVSAAQPGAPPGPADPGKPDKCKLDKDGKEREGFDYLFCKLGLGSSSGSGTGLILAILAAVVIAKAVK